MCSAGRVIVAAAVVVVGVDEEARRDATPNDENSSEAYVSGLLGGVVVQQVRLRKEAKIDLQLHGPATTAENPNEIWESRILPLAGVVLGVAVDGRDVVVVESADLEPLRDEVVQGMATEVVVEVEVKAKVAEPVVPFRFPAPPSQQISEVYPSKAK